VEIFWLRNRERETVGKKRGKTGRETRGENKETDARMIKGKRQKG
jgi:hypothetical protein